MHKTIDWSKVPKWTKVQVKYNKEDRWQNGYFVCKEKYGICTFIISKIAPDKFTGHIPDELMDTEVYEYCKIDKSVEIKDEWYKN